MKKSKSKKNTREVKAQTFALRTREVLAQKRPVLKFVLVFALGVTLFYALYFSDFFTNHISDHIVGVQARASGFLLNIFGFDTEVSKSLITGDRAVLDIKKGCDGIEPTFFFLMGVLLVPFSRKAKLVGLLVGLGVLSVLNIIRIIGLFVASTFWPETFDFLHLHGGFTLFFIVTIIIWIIWANWAIGLTETPAYDKNTA